jgi:hypothetical protein
MPPIPEPLGWLLICLAACFVVLAIHSQRKDQ